MLQMPRHGTGVRGCHGRGGCHGGGGGHGRGGCHRTGVGGCHGRGEAAGGHGRVEAVCRPRREALGGQPHHPAVLPMRAAAGKRPRGGNAGSTARLRGGRTAPSHRSACWEHLVVCSGGHGGLALRPSSFLGTTVQPRDHAGAPARTPFAGKPLSCERCSLSYELQTPAVHSALEQGWGSGEGSPRANAGAHVLLVAPATANAGAPETARATFRT